MLTFQYWQKMLPRLVSSLPMRFSPRYAFPPLHAYFEVTYRCNLRCDMCHYLEIIEDTESNRKYKEERSAEQVCRTIDALPRLAAITFTGGEAIMKHDFQEIFDHACRKNKVHIITNGTLLTDTVIKNLLQNRLKSIWGSGLFFIGVSLEGGEALHDEITQVPGSYRKTLRGLEALIRERNALNSRFPKVHITCVIGNNNVRDLVPLYEYAESLGVEVCNFVLNNTATYWHGKDYDQDDHLAKPTAPVEPIEPQLLREQLDLLEAKSRGFNCQLRFSPNDITPEEIVRYYSNESSYKDYRCHISWSKVAFSAYGDVHSCPHYRLGSFDDGPRGYLWNEERSKKFRERVMKEKFFRAVWVVASPNMWGRENETALTLEI